MAAGGYYKEFLRVTAYFGTHVPGYKIEERWYIDMKEFSDWRNLGLLFYTGKSKFGKKCLNENASIYAELRSIFKMF